MFKNFGRFIKSLMYPEVTPVTSKSLERIVTSKNSWTVSTTLTEYATTIKLVEHETAKFDAIAKIFSSSLFKLTEERMKLLRDDFEKERYWLSRLNHHNVIKLFDDNDSDVLVMEYGEKGDLRSIFNRVPIFKREADARFYFRQLVNVLEYLQSHNIAHGDLNPDNMVVCGNGTLKLCDFSLASTWGYEKVISPYMSYSTPYIAPEVYHRLPIHPAPADIWVSGVTLLALVTDYQWLKPTSGSGRYRQFQMKDFTKEPWVRMSPNLRVLIEGMLREDPDERYTLEDVKKSPWM